MYVVDPLSGAQTGEQANKTGLDEVKGAIPGLPPLPNGNDNNAEGMQTASAHVPSAPGLESQRVATDAKQVQQSQADIVRSKQPLDSVKGDVQDISSSQKQLEERPLPESTQTTQPNAPLQLPKPSIIPPTHGNIPRNLSQ